MGGHTPGPWKAGDTRYNRDFRTCLNVMTEDGLRFVAAVSCDPSTDSGQLLANTRLIAAAPDLLASLLEILGPLNVCSDNPNVADDVSLPIDMTMGELRRARAALLKAKDQPQ